MTYDGASATQSFSGLMGDFGQTMVGETLLLVGCVLAIGGAYWIASWAAARMAGGDWTASKVAARFAHTLVPIALAYAVAHYLTLIIFEGQQLISAISDPFGLGWDLLGTAERKVDFFIMMIADPMRMQTSDAENQGLPRAVSAHAVPASLAKLADVHFNPLNIPATTLDCCAAPMSAWVPAPSS